MALKRQPEETQPELSEEVQRDILRLRVALAEAETCLGDFTRAARKHLGADLMREPDKAGAFESVNRELTEAQQLLAGLKRKLGPIFRSFLPHGEEGWQ